MDPSDLLHQRISLAAENVSIAERELEGALAALKSGDRADKQMITSRLESAFSRLADTRKVLEAALHDAG